eukprot:3244447-Prymnesium_polylepis.2
MSLDGSKLSAAAGSSDQVTYNQPPPGSIWTSSDFGTTWREDTSIAAAKSWGGIAMAWNGSVQTVVAGGYWGGSDYIFTSNDGGLGHGRKIR